MHFCFNLVYIENNQLRFNLLCRCQWLGHLHDTASVIFHVLLKQEADRNNTNWQKYHMVSNCLSQKWLGKTSSLKGGETILAIHPLLTSYNQKMMYGRDNTIYMEYLQCKMEFQTRKKNSLCLRTGGLNQSRSRSGYPFAVKIKKPLCAEKQINESFVWLRREL